MATFALSSYTVRVKQLYHDDYEILGNFLGGNDFLEVYRMFVEDRQDDPSHDTRLGILLRATRMEHNDRTLSGIIETGEYGIETELVNVDTEKMTYRRQTRDAEMRPFYFRALLPTDRKEGIIILQRYKQFGIRGAITRDLNMFVEELFPNLRIELNPLIPETMLRGYLQAGVLKKIRFIKFELPSDIIDAYPEGHVEAGGYTELVVTAGKRSGLPLIDRILQIVDGRMELEELAELQDYDFDYDSVKVELDLGGSRRTIDLSDLSKLKAFYDVDNQLEIGESGHPIYESIDAVSESLMNDLSRTLWV
jgi:hypothetical protein